MTAQGDERTISIDDLLLDPNNPRFVESFSARSEIPDAEVPGWQEDVLKKFRTKLDPDKAGDESFFGIQDLMESMRQIGFVAIDRVVVRRLNVPGAPRYLVIEGNRRVSAAKRLREQNKNEIRPSEKLPERIAQSLEMLDVLLLDTADLTAEQVHDEVGVILGLRHYGSVLEWDAMPKAKNIYTEYMQAPPALSEFALELQRARGVGRRLSVPHSDVLKALKTFVAYLQLNDAFTVGPKPRHYSLLQAIVTNSKLLATGYLSQEAISCRLAPDSLEKINKICQFEQRDSLEAKDKILVEPKFVTVLAGLVEDAFSHSEPAIQGYARRLLEAVEGLERPLDDAVDDLKQFKKSQEWTKHLRQLLKRQQESLRPEDFTQTANDLMGLDEATKAFRYIRYILGV